MASTKSSKLVLINARMSPRVKAAVERQARRDSLSFSDVVRVLLKAYAAGNVNISVSTKQTKKISVQKGKKR